MALGLQLLGAILILAAFGASQRDYLDVHSLPYLLANVLGTAILGTIALLGGQWGFVLLQFTWCAVSLWGIAAHLRAPRAVKGATPARPSYGDDHSS